MIDHYDRRSASPGLLVTMVVCLIMLFSYLAHLAGAPLILGGFAVGIAMGQRFRLHVAQHLHVPFAAAINRAMDAAPHLSEHLEDQIRPLIRVFTPVFFVMVPRGEVGLIFTQVGLANRLLNTEAYAALLIVIALTTALPPFALKAIYARWHLNAAPGE